MSVLDRLIVELALDPKKFTAPAKQSADTLKALEKQAAQTGGGFEGMGKKSADAFAGAKREALALFAIFTGGKSLKAFTVETANANQQLDAMSRKLDISPSKLYKMEAAAKAAGGSFGEVAQTLGTLQKRMMDGKQFPEIFRTFGMLGVSNPVDKKGHIRTDIAELLNQGIRKLRLDPTFASGLMDKLNIGQGMQNIALMKEGDFAKFKEQQEKLKAPSDAAIKANGELAQSISELKSQTDAFATSMLGQLSPELKKVVDLMTAWEQENPKTAKGVALIAAAADELSGSLNSILAVVVSLSGMKMLKSFIGGDKKKYAELLKEIEALKGGASAPGASPIGKTAPLGTNYLKQGRLWRTLPDAPKGATPWGLAAWLTYESMQPQSTNDGEADILKQMRGEGRTGKHSRGLASQSPLFGLLAQRVALKESGGDYSKIGGYNNAYTGKYQMGDGAIKDAAHWLREPVPSRPQFLSDHAMQERFFRAYTDSNNAILSSSSDAYGKLGDLQRMAALGYAHNQGAGGAADWLKTGNSRKDGFGTDGQSYAVDILKAGGAMALNQSDKAEQSAAVKRLKDVQAALREQMTQATKSIGADPSAQLAARAAPGSSAGGGSPNTINASFNGDIVVHTQGRDADAIARDIAPKLRQKLASASTAGLQ